MSRKRVMKGWLSRICWLSETDVAILLRLLERASDDDADRLAEARTLKRVVDQLAQLRTDFRDDALQVREEAARANAQNDFWECPSEQDNLIVDPRTKAKHRRDLACPTPEEMRKMLDAERKAARKREKAKGRPKKLKRD